jgi:hypothetical protein
MRKTCRETTIHLSFSDDRPPVEIRVLIRRNKIEWFTKMTGDVIAASTTPGDYYGIPR